MAAHRQYERVETNEEEEEEVSTTTQRDTYLMSAFTSIDRREPETIHLTLHVLIRHRAPKAK